MTAITLGTTAIRQLDGLYSLNDLHAAAGGEEKHRPNQFIRLDQTQALITEISNAQMCAFRTVRGGQGGTYVCRELVYAYANWISAAFYLKMIRAFDALQGATTPQPAQPALPPRLPIRTRDDLSFTQRDSEGRLINWAVPHDPQGDWPQGVELGQRYFEEVASLAKHNERAALQALEFAIGTDWTPPPGSDWWGGGWGIECGFAKALAQAAILGLKASREGLTLSPPATPRLIGRSRQS